MTTNSSQQINIKQYVVALGKQFKMYTNTIQTYLQFYTSLFYTPLLLKESGVVSPNLLTFNTIALV